jgi:uncharacterized protein YlaN (UPF0358 family)
MSNLHNQTLTAKKTTTQTINKSIKMTLGEMKAQWYVTVSDMVKLWISRKEINHGIKQWLIKSKEMKDKIYILQSDILKMLG